MRLRDEQARRRAATAIDETMLVDAGAGAGKTRILVDRIATLVERGVPIRSIAAVTFTESAATELRDRIRVALSASNPEAVVDLDAAAIGTLHSFARRILAEYPIEADLPPVIEVLDEVGSQVRLGRWWSTVRSRMLEDESLAPALRILLDAGVAVSRWKWSPSLEGLALALQADYDLVEDRLAGRAAPAIPPPDLSSIVPVLDELRSWREQCSDPADRLCQQMDEILAWGEQWLQFEDLSDIVTAWAGHPPFACTLGRQANWPDVKAARQALGDLLAGVNPLGPVFDAALLQVVQFLADEILAAADERRREGQLIYHDLLVLARRLVRRNADVREELQSRYPYLLLDEFQDTDPIQVELAVRIAAGRQGGAPDWRTCTVPDGSLFVVGDPKQSIYRFRRADVATFLDTADFLGPRARAVLSTNFRSHRQILEWVNHVFGALITAKPGLQPAFEPLVESPERIHPDDIPRVILLSDRECAPRVEAGLVADVVATALQEGWPVGDRAIEPSDVTVLVPARSSLKYLEPALAAAGVPYRLMARSLIYGSDEIRDVLMVAAAADDPTNELLVVEALRTPVLGCGDDDLWRWKAAGGSWQPYRGRPETIDGDDPVAGAMDFLHGLGRQLRALAPSEVLSAIIDERDLLTLAAVAADTQEVWRRYRIVVEQARQWAEAAHGSLREYLTWARQRAGGEDRENDIMLPERDAGHVSVMTIHAAKGMEFPMTVVAGLTRRPNVKPGLAVWEQDGVEVALPRGVTTQGWPAASALETTRLSEEDVRLLYVACTRAQEYLVVSGLGRPGHQGWVIAGAAAGAPQMEWSRRRTVIAAGPTHPSPAPVPGWPERHAAVAALSARRQAVSAGAIAHREVPEPRGLQLQGLTFPGLEKAARDLEMPAWLKGRYGTAIGRAVHATLQTVDLATGADALAGTARAQALAEGVEHRAESVVALARSGFAASVVREAAGRPHQKETYVGTVVDEQIVEGYVDLLFTDENGELVLVDYKTDAEPSDAMIAAYQRQLAVYAAALADAVGRAPVRRVLVFCREGRAIEVEV